MRIARMLNGKHVVWGLLAISALLSLVQNPPFSLARAVGDAVGIARLSAVEAQRKVSGPLSSFTWQLISVVPGDACVQLLYPEIEPNQSRRPYTVALASVLAHGLHPRPVRVVTHSHDAVYGEACGTRSRYAVVWIEPAYPRTAVPLAAELEALRSEPLAVQISGYSDDDGNLGYLFEIRGSR